MVRDGISWQLQIVVCSVSFKEIFLLFVFCSRYGWTFFRGQDDELSHQDTYQSIIENFLFLDIAFF